MTKLTDHQAKMICDSEPNPRGGSYGVELWTPQDYAVARSLKAKELGTWEQGWPGNCGLYFNNDEGLLERESLLGIDPDQGHDPDADCLKGW